MKKTLLLLMLMHCVGGLVLAQTGHTNTGTSSGTAGDYNSFFGYFSGNAATSSGTENSFFGAYSGRSTTSGIQNTSIGHGALYLSTTGSRNVGSGHFALYNNTASDNTATGYQALYTNTSGTPNVALGYKALFNNSTGGHNTANGYASLYSNTTASYNTAGGSYSLYSNTTGANNTAQGYQALYSNTTGEQNTSSGYQALYTNTTGRENSAYGYRALKFTTGDYNVAFGSNALEINSTGTDNTAIGRDTHFYGTTGSYNTALGSAAGYGYAGITVSNTTSLGYSASAGASNMVLIGNTSVTSIGGQVGWSTFSDGRFKRNIKEDVLGLDFIKQLRPVSYTVDKEALNNFLGVSDKMKHLEAQQRTAPERQTGFIAQEVEATVKKTGLTFSGVVPPQNDKDHYTIRYGDFVVPLVKAVQELSAKVEEQQKRIDLLTSQLKNTGQGSNEIPSGRETELFQNNPNPYTADTEIKMTLPENGKRADLIVYDMQGTQLKIIQVNDRGNTSVRISGNELAAGMYFYALIVDSEIIDTKRMILTK